MATVTKNDLINHILENSDMGKDVAYNFVQDFFEIIICELEEGRDVKISGFGSFLISDKAARMGRNPKTKEVFPIQARRIVSFHTSTKLKEQVKKVK